MARLASQAKMGYYPTPESVLVLIKNMIEIESNPTQYMAFDPCCGTGEFTRAIPDGVVTYGNDLDKERYQLAKARVDHVLFGDALFDIRATNAAFSCLYLNPPYDWTRDVQGNSVRMEKLFVSATAKYLINKGLLILIIPKEALSHCARAISSNYKKIEVFRFPDPEYDDFHQLVILGYRGNGQDKDTEEKLRMLGDCPEWREAMPMETLDMATASKRFSMPAGKELKTFKSLKINVEDLTQVIAAKDTRVEELFHIEDTDTIKTPMPLRKGHMAMLLASGYMNGEFRNLTEWFLVKGSTRKSVITTEIENGKTELDKIEIVLRAIDMNKGEFLDIK